jgi:hypothetical protein
MKFTNNLHENVDRFIKKTMKSFPPKEVILPGLKCASALPRDSKECSLTPSLLELLLLVASILTCNSLSRPAGWCTNEKIFLSSCRDDKRSANVQIKTVIEKHASGRCRDRRKFKLGPTTTMFS